MYYYVQRKHSNELMKYALNKCLNCPFEFNLFRVVLNTRKYNIHNIDEQKTCKMYFVINFIFILKTFN